jgi:5-formyltetrahydrofolate cyclo-ligase
VTDKKILRQTFLERRNLYKPEDILSGSEAISLALNKLDCVKSSNCIMCYVSFGSEVFTHNTVMEWLKSGKTVCVPYVINLDSNKIMHAIKINDFSELSIGHYGILEPQFDESRIIKPQDIDVIIIPGLAFDFQKNRLGYGGGYYDRYIKDVRKDCNKIAVCFDFQVVDGIPAEIHDERVDMLVTDKRIIY